MNTSLSSQMTLVHVVPYATASTTCREIIGSTYLSIVSRYLLSMPIRLKMFTGVEAGPVTSTLSYIVMMVCCLFSVVDRATVWVVCGL